MALRDKLQDRVQPMLEPGEQIQAVFLCQSGPNPSFILLTYLFMFFSKYWVVAATDKRIAVFKASVMAPSKPKELAESLPRDSPLPDPSGAVFAGFDLGGKRYWVHRRFWKDVRAAAAPVTPAAPAAAPSAPDAPAPPAS
ncbi:MAG TPA: hypothetical protein VGM80_04605 [Gaiellaceae bacterium]|jgi:hypothetical protein